jgi:N-glycosylase/DNA lyase
LKQDPSHLHYRVTWPEASSVPPSLSMQPKEGSNGVEPAADDTEALLRNYFNLQHDLTSLYEVWAKADPNFRKRAPKFTGVRILNQDAWETLICFICSSNNNISRISQMVCHLG